MKQRLLPSAPWPVPLAPRGFDGCHAHVRANPSAALTLVRFGTVLLLLGALVGCSHAPVAEVETPSSPNRALLAEANSSGTWFHAKKTRPIWAKLLEADQTVVTIEGPMTARAGDFLCRGEAGDIWPQRAKTLAERYVATEQIDANGWRQYVPRPDAEGVMATVVQRPFTVTTTWGSQAGKAGDYLLKNYRDRSAPFPEDVWVVDKKLFQATYEPVPP